MAPIADIAGALAPAASPAPPAAGRAEATSKSGHGSATARAKGGNPTRAANGAGADDAFDDFDAQLDAALPDSDGDQDPKALKPTGKGRDEKTSHAEGDRKRNHHGEQTAAAVVLTPWTFIQPVDSAPPNGDAANTSVDATTGADKTAAEKTGVAKTGDDAAVTVSSAAAGSGRSANPADARTVVTGIGAARRLDEGSLPGQEGDAPADASAVDPADGPADGPANDAAPAKGVVLKNGATPDEIVDTAKVAASKDAGAAQGQPPAVSADSAAKGDPGTPAQTAVKTQQPASPVLTSPPVNGGEVRPDAPAATAAAAATQATAAMGVQGAADVQKTNAAPGTRAGRGDKTPGGRPHTSPSRVETQVNASPSQGHGKEHHTPRVDASANVGSVDERRGSAPQGDSAPFASQASGAPAPAEVSVRHEPTPAATGTGGGHVVTAPLTSMGATGSTAADVVLSGDVPVMTAGDVPDSDTPQRLVHSLRMQFLRGGGDAVVQLRPEHLGPVTVSLRVEDGNVEARITAANPVVAEWLEAHHETLREGLQANGLTLDRLMVDRDGRSPDRRGDRREEPRRQQRFRPASEAQSTFELTI
jgi:flagellar hook-length control protein FliK